MSLHVLFFFNFFSPIILRYKTYDSSIVLFLFSRYPNYSTQITNINLIQVGSFFIFVFTFITNFYYFIIYNLQKTYKKFFLNSGDFICFRVFVLVPFFLFIGMSNNPY